MPKQSRSGVGKARHNPLEFDLTRNEVAEQASRRAVGKEKAARKAGAAGGGGDGSEAFLSAKMSQKVLQTARAQQAEVAEEERPRNAVMDRLQASFGGSSPGAAAAPAASRGGRAGGNGGDEDEYSTAELNAEYGGNDAYVQRDGDFVVTAADVGGAEMDDADRRALESFMAKDAAPRLTLAEVIYQKIQEKKAQMEAAKAGGDDSGPQIDPKIVDTFSRVAAVLKKFRSGKLPKVFKIIPSMANWEELLWLTQPDGWSPAATWMATKMFASNLNQKMAQRYYNLVLLPKIRDNIQEFNKLNFYYYMSLKKAIFKPAAFFKGIILPMCEDGDCTLKETAIVCSVLSKVSIPVVHSAAAIEKIAGMRYCATNSMILRVLLDKKYSLPYRVIDAVFRHFMKFMDESRRLPVLWHQSLLVYAQRYKHEITVEQKEALKLLFKYHHHHQITDEVRRELFQSTSRGQDRGDPTQANGAWTLDQL